MREASRSLLSGSIDERGFVDISSTQRLAAYTRELGIERAGSAGASRPDPSTASPRTQENLVANASGIQVSLSTNAQALSQGATQAAERSSDTPNTRLIQENDSPTRASRSNRSLAIEAYQKNASAASGSRIQVRA